MYQFSPAQSPAPRAAGPAVSQQSCPGEGDQAWAQARESLQASICWMPDPKRLKIPPNCESQPQHEQHEPGHQNQSRCQQPLSVSVGLQVWSPSLRPGKTLDALAKKNAFISFFSASQLRHFWKYEGIHGCINPFEIEPAQKAAQRNTHGIGNIQKAKQTTSKIQNLICTLGQTLSSKAFFM